MDLRQFSHRTHINDWFTEYTGSEILGRYCSMSARMFGFSSPYLNAGCQYALDLNGASPTE